jgi:hypothetical protein
LRAKTKAPSAASSSRGSAARPRRPFFHKGGEPPSAAFFPAPLKSELIAGRPGDKFESEADAMADAALRRAPGSGELGVAGVFRQISPLVQRQAEAEEKEEEEQPVQARVETEEEEPVQAKVEVPEKEEDRGQRQVEEEEPEAAVQSPAEKEEEEPVQAASRETEPEKEEVQAQAEAERLEESVQAQLEEEEKEAGAVQARLENSLPPPAPDFVRQQLRARRGRGRPLPDSVQTAMESHFGADFSGIRIHTDHPSVLLTRLLKAQAFTHGRDIYFGAGKFAPVSPAGEHLLAHELTHTIQQGAVGPKEMHPQADPGSLQRQEDKEATIFLRPELLQAIKLARGEIGKVNAKKIAADGTRNGWERLQEYFFRAFGDKEEIHPDVIKFIKKINNKDTMPSWCGIFVWWAYKSAGLPIPDWKLGASILGWVQPRRPGELPRKGDIAYREKNQHFALVTGVESPESAAGKSFKGIRVATINGNTSGEDNLGGQIEEKWEPISRWLAFFDPLAKLDLPPAPLVETGVEPEVEAEAAAAEGASEPEAGEPAPPTDVSRLEEALVAEPDLPKADEAEVAVELPAPPGVPAKEEVAKVEALSLAGSSETALVGFVEASPSQMAATQPSLGAELDSKVNREQQEEAEKAPVLVARTSGRVEEGLTPPEQIPVPGEASLGDGVTGPEPGKLAAAPHENRGAAPSNAENEKSLDKQAEGGFLDWLRNNFRNFLDKIRTKDPGLNTGAGARPNVKLEGEADPERLQNQRQEAEGQLKAQRQAATEAFKSHPGQENIQPKEIKEEKTALLSPEVAVKIETAEDPGAADYVKAPLPAEVRSQADELLAQRLKPNLSEAKVKTEEAAQKRDKDKAAEIANAENEAARINQKADKDQRDIVVQNRREVAKQQKTGIEEAYAQVNDFNREADKEQTAARKEIGNKVKDSESRAREELDKGEKDADRKKQEGEQKAAAKKEELEKDQKKESWWKRAANAVKKAVKAITKAIDVIFNEIRAAVKTIIEKAKNAAIALINAARDWIVDKLNKFRDWAKSMVDTYLKDRFPNLAKRINGAIDAVVDTAIAGVNFVADAAIAGIEALASALSKALDKILQVFQTALKAAVQIAGAIITGDFAEALRIAVQAACDIAGIDSKPIFDFIDRAAAQVMKILKAPGEFFNNLMAAVGGGVRNFAKNIRKHLISGLIGWLTGALSEAAITLPEKFDARGIFSLVMQILGLTYANIKAKVIKRLPGAAKVFSAVEQGFEIVRRLVTEGPIALWEQFKQSLADFKEIVLSGIRNFVITTVVKEAITWLLGLLNPAAAIVKVVKLLFDFVMFLVERFQQIKDFVLSVYNSIAAIAAGAVEKATQAVEDALGRSLPVVISLLASLAGLGGIGKTVKNIIAKVSKPVNRLVNALVDRIVKFAKKLLAKGKAAAKKVQEKVRQWWSLKKSFTDAGGASHTLSYRGAGKAATLMIKSSPAPLETFLSQAKDGISGLEGGQKAKMQTALDQSRSTYGKIKTVQNKLEVSKADQDFHTLQQLHNDLARQISPLFSLAAGGALPTAVLPPFADGVKAGSIRAKFISLDRSKTPAGQAASAHRGALRGWDRLVQTGLREKENWVKMHLLHHNLGGKATDSNLTPAKSSINQRFYRELERPALETLKGGKKAIWYAVDISYHSSEPDFINSVRAKYGLHQPAKNWAAGPVEKEWGTQVEPPRFEELEKAQAQEVVSLNESGSTILGRFKFDDKKLDQRFINMLIEERNKSLQTGGFLKYSGLDNLLNRLQVRYPQEMPVITPGVSLLMRAKMKGQFKT